MLRNKSHRVQLWHVLVGLFLLVFGAMGLVPTYALAGTQDGLILYGEEETSPKYRVVTSGSVGSETSASSVSEQPDWISAANAAGSEEVVMVTLDEKSDVNAQVWDGDSWGSVTELTASGKVGQNSIDVVYEGSSGDALAAYVDLSGVAADDKKPHYNTWNGTSWSNQGMAGTVNSVPNSVELAADPGSDEILLATNDGTSDVNVQVWDGSSWGSVTEVTTNAYSSGQPFDVAYESSSGDGLIVYTNKDNSDTSIHYRTVVNGSVGSEQTGPTLGDYGRMYTLVSDPGSDEIVLVVLDNDKDTSVLIWDGSSWSNKGEVATNAQSLTYRNASAAYESNSGDVVIVYGDNTDVPKYRTWNGSTLSSESSLPTAQHNVRWVDAAADQSSDDVTVVLNTRNNHIDGYVWDGSSWTKTTVSTSNTTSSRGGISAIYEDGDPPTAPDAPSNLSADPVVGTTTDSVTITWDDNSDNEDGFSLERSTTSASGPFVEIHESGANAEFYFDGPLGSGTYWYRVRAFNTVGNSAYSNTDSAIIP